MQLDTMTQIADFDTTQDFLQRMEELGADREQLRDLRDTANSLTTAMAFIPKRTYRVLLMREAGTGDLYLTPTALNQSKQVVIRKVCGIVYKRRYWFFGPRRITFK